MMCDFGGGDCASADVHKAQYVGLDMLTSFFFPRNGLHMILVHKARCVEDELLPSEVGLHEKRRCT